MITKTVASRTPDQPGLSANITINKNRVKVYDESSIYMDDGTEFEIELTNHTSYNYLAKIFINREPIGNSNLVVRPGQHIYLERFLDEPKRFRFDTYTVEDTEAVRSAIRNNGYVRVEFYKEKVPTTSTWWYYYPHEAPHWTNDPSIPPTWKYSDTTTGIVTACSAGATYDSGIEFNSSETYTNNNNIETGRVERGSKSSQEFKNVCMSFESHSTKVVQYKIYPSSAQSDISEIRFYCSDCGRRKRKSERYCPRCGTKL